MTATRNMTEDELRKQPVRMGIKAAAAALGIGINEAYRQAAAGEFPCRINKRGGAWIVYRPDLMRALGYSDVLEAS